MPKKISNKTRREDELSMESVLNDVEQIQKTSIEGVQDESTKTNNKTTKLNVLNINNELETIIFATDEMLESQALEDSTVEIIGFIDEIEGPKIVGKVQQYRMMKFLLNNNSRHRIQVVAWNKEIDKVEHLIKPNNIIHIDGGKSKRPKFQEYNKGTLPYEILIQQNTILNNLGTFDVKSNLKAHKCDTIINLEDVPKYINSFILVQGLIKTNFNSITINSNNFACGSITDGKFKLEVQIKDYDNEINEFEKGQHVDVKGYVKIRNDIFYLQVEKNADIKVIDSEKLSFMDRFSGSKTITKRSCSDENPEKNKKIIKLSNA